MITKELAIDLIKDNVWVNNIVIGYVANASNTNRQAEQTIHLGNRFPNSANARR